MNPALKTSPADRAEWICGLRATLAIAAQAVRAAVRSRLLITLVLLLLLTLFGLPASIKGDGTLAGKLRILLEYNLGLTAILLAAATLWTACGAISQEVQYKQIALLAVKPVHRWQIWLGKWLGLVAINIVLLAGAGLATCLFVLQSVRSSSVSPDEFRQVKQSILQGRRRVGARPESVDDIARARLQDLTKRGLVPAETTPREAFALLKHDLLAERSIVAPGRERTWVFDPPRGGWPRASAGRNIVLRTRHRASVLEGLPVSGTWSVGGGEQTDSVKMRMEQGMGGIRQLDVPAAALSGAGPAIVRFANDKHGTSSSAVFDRDEAVELLIEESGFSSNLTRALLVIGCLLALLAALGLTAGSLLSFPVATFVSAALLVLSLLSHFFAMAASSEGAFDDGHAHGSEAASPWLDKAGEFVRDAAEAAAGPVLQFDPLTRLSDGVLIPWAMVGKALGLAVMLYGGVLGTLGGGFLSRRELALPGG